MSPQARFAALALTLASGAAGLGYEVVWQRYLGTLLGSQSEATAVVLALFLAGLATGYAVFGRLCAREPRTHRLLLVYAAVEAAIGVYAWLFPAIFSVLRSASAALAPASDALAFATDVGWAALVILPPTIAMGSTIPILTQALSRDVGEATRVHAWVYGLNTLGATAGALLVGFVLIPAAGLGGGLRWLGTLSLAVGVGFLWIAPTAPSPAAEESPPEALQTSYAPPGTRWVSFAALLLGFAMMVVQIVANRLGALALGSSHFTFSIVVAVFVFSLGAGSLAVSAFRRIPRYAAALAPWLVAVALILAYPLLDEVPYAGHLLRSLFRDTSATFYPYQLTLFVSFLVVAALPLGLAGATLPLIFDLLKRERDDLGAIAGRLYQWNTVGSVLGALIGGYALFFWLDLADVARVALAALAVASAILSARALPGRVRSAAVLALVPALAAILVLPTWSRERLNAGLFRVRAPVERSYAGADLFFAKAEAKPKIVFAVDDPTGLIVVAEERRPDGSVDHAIVVNGKSDGLLFGEYTTTTLCGLLPALFAEKAERAFVIGYGTGVTASELAQLDSMRSVAVAEISRGVLAASRFFDYGNGDASTNPKLELLRGDAFRILTRSEKRYDVIASEPSNPWVSGVEMLFSREFLSLARDRLAPGGVHAQWLHTYEIDQKSVALILRTYASVFEHMSVWFAEGPDILLLGFESSERMLDTARLIRRAQRTDFAAGLARAGLDAPDALLVHELWPAGVAHAALAPGPLHSLDHPRLANWAARAFHLGRATRLPPSIAPPAGDLGARNSLLRRHRGQLGHRERRELWPRLIAEACRTRVTLCAVLVTRWRVEEPQSPVRDALVASLSEQSELAGALEASVLADLQDFFAESSLADGPGRGELDFTETARRSELFARTYHHAAPFETERIAQVWRRCRAPNNSCAEGRERTERVLGSLRSREPSP